VSDVAGVMQAWYPGSEGGPAIARVLSGAVNPSGRLPASFPRSVEQLPRPHIVGQELSEGTPCSVRWEEGAAVGYRWYERRKLQPLFSFGYGLSYTEFSQGELAAQVVGQELEVTFRASNTGGRAGKHVAQVYVSPRAGGWEAPRRLGAFTKVELAPGESRRVTLPVDARLCATFDVARQAFKVAAGEYVVTLAASAADPGQSVSVRLAERWLPAGAGAHVMGTSGGPR
jgi:beta-glucosidase